MLGISFVGETKDSERILSGSAAVSGVDKEACKHFGLYQAPVTDLYLNSMQHWHMWGNIGTSGYVRELYPNCKFPWVLNYTTRRMALKPMYSGNIFQMQCLGLNLPEHLPTDLDGIRKLFVDITDRKSVV